MIRSSCVICDGQLDELYTLQNAPVTFSPVTTPYETDVYNDISMSFCTSCSCVQLKTLIDQTVLYSESHNGTADTPTWKEHHSQFADFVRNHNIQRITEIGGSSGSLYRHIKDDVDYACLDLCEPSTEIPNFIKANCETYDFTNTDTICMSHVFEHLYAPRRFIENISEHVSTVIISIPNMNHLLSMKSSSIVFNEHTYFVDKHNAEWLFGQYGYVLKKSQEFKNHSIFMSFQKSPDPVNVTLENRTYIPKQMKAIFQDMFRRFSSIPRYENAYIAPAGHMGQLVYCHGKLDSIIGFLDNDTSKQSRRVYGTPYLALPFHTIQSMDRPSIYVYAGVYTDEIVAQILSINKTAKIYII